MAGEQVRPRTMFEVWALPKVRIPKGVANLQPRAIAIRAPALHAHPAALDGSRPYLGGVNRTPPSPSNAHKQLCTSIGAPCKAIRLPTLHRFIVNFADG